MTIGKSASLDAVDQAIVIALQTDGRAPWAKVAGLAGVSESTAARRGSRLLQSGVVTVSALPDPLRTGLGQPVLVALSVAPGQARLVADELAARSDARFVSVVTGTSDVLVELVVPGPRALAAVLLDEVQAHPAVLASRTETVLRTCKVSFDWAGEDPTDEDPVGPATPSTIRPATGSSDELDQVELCLLMALAQDGRRTFADLGAEAGVSESQAARRVNALRARGAVVFATHVDPAVLGFDVEAFLHLRIALTHLEEAAATLTRCRAVRYLSLTAGRADIVAEVVLPDPAALLDFRVRVLAHLPGLLEASTELELITVKRAYRRGRHAADPGPTGPTYPSPRTEPRDLDR